MRQENCISSRGFEYGVKHFISPFHGPIADVISDALNLPIATVQDLITLGAVYHNKIRIHENIVIQTKDYIRVHTNPRRFPTETFNWRDRTCFETSDFIVLNKPGGLPCHPTVDNRIENLLNYAQKYFNTNLYITHRLDVPTSGLIVLAKTVRYRALFNQYLQDRRIKKIYKAKVSGKPQVGHYIHYMERSYRAPKNVSPICKPGDLTCELEIINVDYNELNHWSDCEINLLTGRTHQIRAQMSIMGCPIFGDSLYKSKFHWKLDQIALICKKIIIPDINNDLNIHVELPITSNIF